MIRIESATNLKINSSDFIELVRSGEFTPNSESSAPRPETPVNLLGYDSAEELFTRVNELRELIEGKREQFRDIATLYLIPEGWHLELEMRGAGATYYLIDTEGNKQCVIKPNDEDVLLMNNPKGYGSLEMEFWPGLPFYENVQTAVACYQIAELMDIAWITPKTELAIIDHDGFYLIGDRFPLTFRDRFEESTGLTSHEKLVSIQTFCDGALPFDEVYHEHLAEGKPFMLDQSDYEAVMVLEWLTFECDGHMGNLLAVPREDGKWGVIKVDNNLSLPEQNVWYNNVLAYFRDNAKEHLSEEMRERIAQMPIAEMEQRLERLGKSARCRTAFVQRCEMLKELSEQDLTIAQIEQAYNRLEAQNEAANDWSTTGSDDIGSGGRDETD